jgi:hypothetical protein
LETTGGAGGAPINDPAGCDCSIPGKTSTNHSFWIALFVTLGVCRRHRHAPCPHSH